MAKIREMSGSVFLFHCPGCGCLHFFQTIPNRHPTWDWNGDFEKPTVSPSIRVNHGDRICHFFVKDGRIQFLSDSYHDLRNQTVEMENWDV